MKNSFLLLIIIFSSLVYSGNYFCDLLSLSYENIVNANILPTKSDKYYAVSKTNTYSNGEPHKIGEGFMYANWKHDWWYKIHDISCSITNIESKVNLYSDNYESCYLITLDCSVIERTQFYIANVKYTDLKGYRTNGTLRWTRDKIGSTDIYCYNKTGMSIIKRVNDPQYCN